MGRSWVSPSTRHPSTLICLVDARPIEQKKRGRAKQIIFSVKSGKVDVTHVRDLRGVIDRENAQIGVLISLHEPTRPMRTEAASAGFYTTGWNESYPRLQLLTIAELLDGTGAAYPAWSENSTYKSPPRVQAQGDQAHPRRQQRADTACTPTGSASPGSGPATPRRHRRHRARSARRADQALRAPAAGSRVPHPPGPLTPP
jgi:hypothetical protein